jgi:hypothetical protein
MQTALARQRGGSSGYTVISRGAAKGAKIIHGSQRLRAWA